MNLTEARLATLREEVVAKYAACAEAQRNHLFGIANTSAFDFAERLVSAYDAMRDYIEAEAKGAEPVATTGTKFGGPSVSVVAEPAPPPARPKRVRVTERAVGDLKDALVVGKVYDVFDWDNNGRPSVKNENGYSWSLSDRPGEWDTVDSSLSKWVPADEPGVDEARERNELLTALELILPLAKGYACANNVGSNQAYVSIAEATLARSRVKS